jgi:hypothetical protein
VLLRECYRESVNAQWPSGLKCYYEYYFAHGTYSVTSSIPAAGDVHVFFSIQLIVDYQTNIHYYYYYRIFGTSLLKYILYYCWQMCCAECFTEAGNSYRIKGQVFSF